MSVRKLLTCVVPCYNSAAYMERAVDSLLAGGEEMEILIVDDGSTDETGAIADRLEKEHPSVIRVRHQENRGHGSALNYGIANAEGVYFKVVDSDDRLVKENLPGLMDLLRQYADPENRADMVFIIGQMAACKLGEPEHLCQDIGCCHLGTFELSEAILLQLFIHLHCFWLQFNLSYFLPDLWQIKALRLSHPVGDAVHPL